MSPKWPLLAVTAALLALLPPVGASAYSNHRCKSPRGMRAATQGLKAGLGTSCGTALKVAATWDRRCDVYTGLCGVQAGGRRWSCRAFTSYQTHNSPARFRSRVDVKCGGRETSRGRPSVNFHQAHAVHPCSHPGGTQAQIRWLVGYYGAGCKVATPVATGWDRACDPAQDGSSCAFSARGGRWTCAQEGRPGVDATYTYVCAAPGVDRGRVSVVFLVRVMPLPPGVPDQG